MDVARCFIHRSAMGKATIVAWGSYDRSKPRVRLLLSALRKSKALAGELEIEAWRGVKDKSQMGRWRLLKEAALLLSAFPAATLKLARLPKHSAILLPYPAIPGIFFAALIARLRGFTLIMDAFLPLHDTIVRDRKMYKPGSLLARLVWLTEKAALRLADIILVDTDQHGEFLASEFGLDRDMFLTILVGAEPLFQEPSDRYPKVRTPGDKPLVLFYGQLIPLHGMDTILQAARITADDAFHWLIVGQGQDEALLRAALDGGAMRNVTWERWIEYEQLPGLIRSADLCLGIFGSSGKAGRVIPNKMFQILSAGKPILTRDSPAVKALASDYPDTVLTVPAADPQALAEAARRILTGGIRMRPLPGAALTVLQPDEGVKTLLARLAAGKCQTCPRRDQFGRSDDHA